MNLQNKRLSVTKRTRVTPYTQRVEEAGVQAYAVYNHMLLPGLFTTYEQEYWHLCEHVQVWDVAVERQVEISGPDAAKLVQLMTPRDLSKTKLLQGKYAPICDEQGKLLNDPIVIKFSDDRWWLSISSSDLKLFAKGLAIGMGLDVKVFEPDVSPLAVQGPKAEELCARVFGEEIRSIKFFHGKMLPWRGEEIYVARSGWSHQGGFEIYLHKSELGVDLWDDLFEKGADLNVAPGYPHGVERLESGLLSYGSDMDENDTPFECGLDSYLNLDADVESLSLPALREHAGKQTRKLMGILFEEGVDVSDTFNLRGGYDVVVGDRIVGEIRSQAWSFRYQKFMMYAMMDIEFLTLNDSLMINGVEGKIHPLPLFKAALEFDDSKESSDV